MKRIINLLLLLCAPISVWAQGVVSSVDSTQIKIGSAFEFIIKANAQKGDVVQFPNAPQMGPFEVLESKAVDTVLKEKKLEYIKKYLLTQFDSGTYTLPRQSVYINGKNFQTDLFSIQVHNVQVDTLKQPMYDIKSNQGTATDTSKLPLYIIGALVCFFFGFLTYWLIKRQQNKNLSEEDLYRTPLEKVTKKLQELDEKKWVTEGDIKSYYSEITDIARDYIEEVFEIPAKESTSSELIRLLTTTIKNKKIKLNKETISDLKRVLQTADLVKFAKSEPQPYEIASDRKTTESISLEIDKALPRFAEEQSTRVRLREERFRKRKRLRTWAPIGVSFLLLLGLGGVYLWQSVHDGLTIRFLQSNKRIFQQEWVRSTYGYPSLTLETPEALVRMAPATGEKPSKPQSLVNFMYQNQQTDLTINLSTTKLATDESTDSEQIFKTKLQRLEKNIGAQNITSEAEKFNQQGVEGLRGFGSFSRLNPKTSKEQMYQFELYLFIQKEGIQEISVIYPFGDTYGQKIAQKVLESIELDQNKL